jgi:hypothetical protein
MSKKAPASERRSKKGEAFKFSSFSASLIVNAFKACYEGKRGAEGVNDSMEDKKKRIDTLIEEGRLEEASKEVLGKGALEMMKDGVFIFHFISYSSSWKSSSPLRLGEDNSPTF